MSAATVDDGQPARAAGGKLGGRIVALFAPEHGIRGAVAEPAEGGTGDQTVWVESGVDQVTGLPVRSLYGATLKPTPEMLADIEVLLFDIQDIGARYYTYVSTMALAMQGAAENDTGQGIGQRRYHAARREQ